MICKVEIRHIITVDLQLVDLHVDEMMTTNFPKKDRCVFDGFDFASSC